jgi:hypothetical protein
MYHHLLWLMLRLRRASSPCLCLVFHRHLQMENLQAQQKKVQKGQATDVDACISIQLHAFPCYVQKTHALEKLASVLLSFLLADSKRACLVHMLQTLLGSQIVRRIQTGALSSEQVSRQPLVVFTFLPLYWPASPTLICSKWLTANMQDSPL